MPSCQMNTKTLYQALTEAGCQVENHESDLYVKCTDQSRAIVKAYKRDHDISYSLFISAVDESLWIEAPFAFDPFWNAKR